MPKRPALHLVDPPYLGDRSRFWMQPDEVTVDGRRIELAVSDNSDDDGPWAINIHGFFAGGGMYWRESVRLAGLLGWRVVNPSLPAFGGSDPLPWDDLGLEAYARTVVEVMDHLGIERAVLLGHSMGGVVALRTVRDHAERVLGVVYRDGAAPGSWKERKGLLARLVQPVSPDLAAGIDITASVLADVPDLAYGRLAATVKGVLPDATRNLRSFGQSFPVAAMLFNEGADHLVEGMAATGVPVLPMWGRFDRIVPPSTGRAFSDAVGEPIVWVTGGHSWMLPRPVTQARVLADHEQGRSFVRAVAERDRALAGGGAAAAAAARRRRRAGDRRD